LKTIQDRLLEWYRGHGRAALPWRVVRNPYYTLVSEFMLQQTQVDRVVPAFRAFVKRFPDFASLARAARGDVLRQWRGLGYNARAIRLKGVAEAVVERYAGTMPADATALRSLPGIGSYTAAAIRVFAFDIDDAPIDTNIRRIVHRLFFGVEYPGAASAHELDERARRLVPPGAAHDWNSALMDLGATVCTARTPKCLLCPLRSDCAAAPIDADSLDAARLASARLGSTQAAVAFERTTRYARGRIIDLLRDLPPGEHVSLLDLHRSIEAVVPGRSIEEVRALVSALERDGLVSRDGERLALPDS
jgi:A/G-specific adenine glycosylase